MSTWDRGKNLGLALSLCELGEDGLQGTKSQRLQYEFSHSPNPTTTPPDILWPLITRRVLNNKKPVEFPPPLGGRRRQECSGGIQVSSLLASDFGSRAALMLPCHFCLILLLSCHRWRQPVTQSTVGKRKKTLESFLPPNPLDVSGFPLLQAVISPSPAVKHIHLPKSSHIFMLAHENGWDLPMFSCCCSPLLGSEKKTNNMQRLEPYGTPKY